MYDLHHVEAEALTLNDIFSVEEEMIPMAKTLANYWPSLQLFEEDSLLAEAEDLSESLLARGDVADDFSLLSNPLEAASSYDEFIQLCTERQVKIHEALAENTRRFYTAAERQRRTLYALNLAYEHGNGDIMVMPVDYGFGSSRSPYLARFKHVMTQAFQKFRINSKDSPSHVAFLAPITSVSTLKKLGRILKENLAMGFVSLPNLSREKLFNFLEKKPIKGSDGNNAFIAAVAVHGKLNEVDKIPGGEPLDIPLSGPLATLMGRGEMGCNVFGLLNNGLAIDGITAKYRYETEDSVLLSEHGTLQVLPYGPITGVRTTYSGGVSAYRRIPSMDVFIGVNRSMAALMREYAYSDWDDTAEENFIATLKNYFSNLFRDRVLGGQIDPNEILINYDDEKGRVDVTVPVSYKGVAENFTFHLVSNNGHFALKETVLS